MKLLLCLSLAAPVAAQHFGVKIGVPLTAYFDTGRTATIEYSAATRRYTAGLSAEWRFLELDVLYHRMGWVAIAPESAVDIKANSWDFPLLAKYRFGKPFLAAGAVLRYAGALGKRFYPGFTAAAGIEWPAGRLRIVPEFRYTRWTGNIAGTSGLLRFKPDQAEVLLGAVF